MSSPIADNARVCYLGPEGTYTEEAARFFFSSGVFRPKATVPEAIADVREGNADYAVIPQENTLGGAVINYVDALSFRALPISEGSELVLNVPEGFYLYELKDPQSFQLYLMNESKR